VGQRPGAFSRVCALLGLPWFAAPDLFPLMLLLLALLYAFTASLPEDIWVLPMRLPPLQERRLPRVGLQDFPCATMMTGSSQRAYNAWSNCLLRGFPPFTSADGVHAGVFFTLAVDTLVVFGGNAAACCAVGGGW
jgi:hypothetical protein